MTSFEETRNQKYRFEEREEIEPKRRLRKRNVVLLIVGALLLFFGSFWAAQSFTGNDEVQVPSLINKTVLEAEKLLNAQSLKIVIADEVYSADAPKGVIINQKPAATSTVKKGREIQVVLSLGIEKVQVPDLTGKNQQAWKVELENAGLILGEISMVTSKDHPYGVVVYQSPEAGVEVEPGSSVNIMVNEPPEVTVPSLIGKTQAQAQQDLQLIGLGIGGITTEPSDQYVKGIVIRQEPLADTVLHEGDSVTMVISSGPGPEQFAQFELIVPKSGTVVASISDAKGTTELFREYCFAGERVQKSFTHFGTAQLTITSNNEIIMEKTYEP